MVSAGFAGGRCLALVAVRHTLLHPGLLALAHDCGRLVVLRRPLVHIVVIHPRRAPALAAATVLRHVTARCHLVTVQEWHRCLDWGAGRDGRTAKLPVCGKLRNVRTGSGATFAV